MSFAVVVAVLIAVIGTIRMVTMAKKNDVHSYAHYKKEFNKMNPPKIRHPITDDDYDEVSDRNDIVTNVEYYGLTGNMFGHHDD